jgi:hypothetical protein
VRSVVYPVKATVDGREITGAKLVVTLAAAYLYVSDHTGVVEAWSADLTGEPALARPWEGRGYTSTLPTAGGDVVVTNLGGCGCGNQVLKHYRPFPSGPARIT